jgi:hypothetical protein
MHAPQSTFVAPAVVVVACDNGVEEVPVDDTDGKTDDVMGDL